MTRLPFDHSPRTPARSRAKPAAGSREAPYSIRQLSGRIRKLVEAGFPGRGVWVEGEIHQAGGNYHRYLTFKDGDILIEAVIWGSTLRWLTFRPAKGDLVRAFGEVKTYERKSQYQLILHRVERIGLGRLLQELKEREARLEREGLFDASRKRKLPFLPRRIGLLTARGSAASRDFFKVALERFPGLRISERDTHVQGSAAVPDLVAGLHWLGTRNLDVIVITRGGGSAEDLLPFSDEGVIRAAARCPIPLVSAIGHERDHPLLDRVADFRAATPTEAAEKVIRERRQLQREIEDRLDSARRALRTSMGAARDRLDGFRAHRASHALPEWIERERTARRADGERLRKIALAAVRSREKRVRQLGRRLEAVHPERRLGQQERVLGVLRARRAGLDLLRPYERRLRDCESAAGKALFATETRITEQEGSLDGSAARVGARTDRLFDRFRARCRTLRVELRQRDPRAPLKRGYGLALDPAGRAVYSAARVAPGERLRLLLASGELGVRVETVQPGDETDSPAKGAPR